MRRRLGGLPGDESVRQIVVGNAGKCIYRANFGWRGFELLAEKCAVPSDGASRAPFWPTLLIQCTLGIERQISWASYNDRFVNRVGDEVASIQSNRERLFEPDLRCVYHGQSEADPHVSKQIRIGPLTWLETWG